MKPIITIRPDWLVFGEGQQWRAKPPKARGIGVVRFACVAGFRRHVGSEAGAAGAESVANR
jgi:hypothetical protein